MTDIMAIVHRGVVLLLNHTILQISYNSNRLICYFVGENRVLDELLTAMTYIKEARLKKINAKLNEPNMVDHQLKSFFLLSLKLSSTHTFNHGLNHGFTYVLNQPNSCSLLTVAHSPSQLITQPHS